MKGISSCSFIHNKVINNNSTAESTMHQYHRCSSSGGVPQHGQEGTTNALMNSPGKARGNLRNSFYAHKFRNSKPQPNLQQLCPVTDICQPPNQTNMGQFLASTRPTSSKMCNNFMGAKTEGYHGKRGPRNSVHIGEEKEVGKKSSLGDRRISRNGYEFDNIKSDMNEYFTTMKQQIIVKD